MGGAWTAEPVFFTYLEMIRGNGGFNLAWGPGDGGLQGWQRPSGGARLAPANVNRKIISFGSKESPRFAPCCLLRGLSASVRLDVGAFCLQNSTR